MTTDNIMTTTTMSVKENEDFKLIRPSRRRLSFTLSRNNNSRMLFSKSKSSSAQFSFCYHNIISPSFLQPNNGGTECFAIKIQCFCHGSRAIKLFANCSLFQTLLRVVAAAAKPTKKMEQKNPAGFHFTMKVFKPINNVAP
jgi:hypothetical protein